MALKGRNGIRQLTGKNHEVKGELFFLVVHCFINKEASVCLNPVRKIC